MLMFYYTISSKHKSMLSQYLDELGQQMPVILFVPKPAILRHIVCSVMKRQEDITQMSAIDAFLEGQNRNKLFYDRVLSRVPVECNTGHVFFRAGEGHSCFTEICLYIVYSVL